jgi:hypothetical protein
MFCFERFTIKFPFSEKLLGYSTNPIRDLRLAGAVVIWSYRVPQVHQHLNQRALLQSSNAKITAATFSGESE